MLCEVNDCDRLSCIIDVTCFAETFLRKSTIEIVDQSITNDSHHEADYSSNSGQIIPSYNGFLTLRIYLAFAG